MNNDTGPLELYTRAASASSAVVIGRYSTSFGAAARLLGAGVRSQVRDIYALVRVADEIVDGAAAAAGLTIEEQNSRLDEFEAETDRAIATGFSTNLVVHAFAVTARASGIGTDLTAPFFASMRRDLDDSPFVAGEIDAYIFGSAEVVGLMCLRTFLAGQSVSADERGVLEDGARHLGAAFQKVNFLRDLSADWTSLGRNYFPAVDPARMTEEEKIAILDDIDDDLAIAAQALTLLPRSSRGAVAAAHGLFRRLSTKLRATPAADLLTSRVRVPDAEKLGIALRAATTRGR
ncbi:phytoene/squalene synthase family protein [Leifsonia sp. Leaf264]|uniref:phytoene/squalene synthase family protein n=1 Tax=Leifsonia sp. Leaf264 TaxID=1736314 RepID=UPI0006F84DE4|nr:squalene/phytoene synthase family protein [Leifsonia sp. Leaf264]KQO99730.1 phytoene synthase [Leifsonia sp. Leaf264]